MLHHKELPATVTVYKTPESTQTCILCGKDALPVHFKGKCVCEACMNFVKDLY